MRATCPAHLVLLDLVSLKALVNSTNYEAPHYVILVRIANELFENATKFKYLGTTLKNQNDIHDEIKSRLNSGNAYYHSVQNLLSSRLIPKK
jgi:hypothetical protein